MIREARRKGEAMSNLPKYFYFRVKATRKGTAIEVEDASDCDVVEVVRCGDCRYSRDEYEDGDCYCKRPGRELQWIGRRWDFFCAAGRKKGEDR